MDRETRLALNHEARIAVAEEIRQACIDAAVGAAEDAGIRGLCADGQLQAAIDSIRNLRVEEVVTGR